MERSLPFAHLNLRRNPFGELDLSERQKIAVVDTKWIVHRLRVPGFAVQFIGAKGCGKTSGLLSLRCFYPSAPYMYIKEGESPSVPRGTPLFIDEAQRMPRPRRRRIFRRKASFAIGTHEDLTEELRDTGLVVQTIRPGQRLSARRLQEIFQRRIEHVRRGSGPVPSIRYQTILTLMDTFGDDVRGMEDHLYEIFQLLGGVQDV